jgi:hypothetical protein
VRHREVTDRVAGHRRSHLRDPRRQVLARHPAQHRVDERPGPLAHDRARQLDRRADRRVRRHAHRQQLVAAQPEQVEDRRVDRPEGAVDARTEHCVVRPATAQRPVTQLGGERGVAPVEPTLAQQAGQHEVGVGVALVDGP